MTDSESPEDQLDLNDPAIFAVLQRGMAAARARDAALTELEKVEVIGAEAEVRLKQARARRAQHRAAAEPERQRMSLKERETKRRIRIGLAIFTPAFLVGALLLAPWVIPSTGFAGALAYLWRGGGG